MQIVRIIVFVLIGLYLLFSFIFVHISLSALKQLKKSKEVLANLFQSQIDIFALLDNELKTTFSFDERLDLSLANRDYKELNKIMAKVAKSLQEVKSTISSDNNNVIALYKGMDENIDLIRNEVYRYNKIVDNININCDSIIFSLFVALMQLKPQEKI